jgi:hypothetical protein
MIKHILLNGVDICYDLQRKKVKNLNIRIKSDQTISVSVPPFVTDQVVEKFLAEKSDFILRAISRFSSCYHCVPKDYADGEMIFFLGKEIICRTRIGKQNRVFLEDSLITIQVRDSTDQQLQKRLLDRWLQDCCQKVTYQVCQSVYIQFQPYKVAWPEIRFRKMTSRWGSCLPKSNILTFNTALIHLPLPCLEYVVYHEFVHFLHPDHSPAFYSCLASFLPDWKERKNLLDQYRIN